MTTTTELKLEGRILKAGQFVKISRERGWFKILGFDTLKLTVDVYGGPPNQEALRTFFIERIGKRRRLTA